MRATSAGVAVTTTDLASARSIAAPVRAIAVRARTVATPSTR
jgi:hypothetical protein